MFSLAHAYIDDARARVGRALLRSTGRLFKDVRWVLRIVVERKVAYVCCFVIIIIISALLDMLVMVALPVHDEGAVAIRARKDSLPELVADGSRRCEL